MSSYVTREEHSRTCHEDKRMLSFGKQRYQQVVSSILLPGKYLYLGTTATLCNWSEVCHFCCF